MKQSIAYAVLIMLGNLSQTHALRQGPDVLQTWTMPTLSLDVLPDVDGDGRPELMVGDRLFSTPSLENAGRHRVVSSSGPILFEVVGTSRGQLMGATDAHVGDVNADGFADYMISGDEGQAQIRSGRDGRLLFTHVSTSADGAALGDVNGDGKGDFLISGFFYYGGTFEVRQRFFPPPGAVGFTTRVVVMGDVDGDDFVDFAISAPGLGFKIGTPGKVFVYSGREGTILHTLSNPTSATGDSFGHTVEAPGDFTGDGITDLVIGAYECCDSVRSRGRVCLFDGKRGELLGAVDATVLQSRFGLHMDDLGDLDGNGYPDVLFSTDRFLGRDALALDGLRRSVFRIYDIGQGSPASGGYDWNGDGFPDFLRRFLSRIELISGAPPNTQVVGEPCGLVLQKSPRIGATHAPLVGQPYEVHLSDVPPGIVAVLRVGGPGKTTAISPGSRRPCAFLENVALEQLVSASKIGPNRGAATVEIQIPADPTLIGQRFSVQWAVLGARGQPVAYTRVLRPMIGQ